MTFETALTDTFMKEAKRLSKKYPSLKGEIAEFCAVLAENPRAGTPLGNSCFKNRLAIRSKGRGKSGGARIITMVSEKIMRVYILTIYDKSEHSTISDRDIQTIISGISDTHVIEI